MWKVAFIFLIACGAPEEAFNDVDGGQAPDAADAKCALVAPGQYVCGAPLNADPIECAANDVPCEAFTVTDSTRKADRFCCSGTCEAVRTQSTFVFRCEQ